MQEGLVIEEPAYEALIDEFAEMKQRGITGYRVVWKADGKEHQSTEYVIKAFDDHLGEPTAIMWGRGGNRETGGKYEIIPKPDDNAWLRYHHPNASPEDYKLTRLAVFSPDFIYEDTDDYSTFWKNPFEKLAEIKDRRI
jgi:hypothetical protein